MLFPFQMVQPALWDCRLGHAGVQQHQQLPRQCQSCQDCGNTISTYYHLRQHEIVVRYSPPPATNDFTITQQYSTMIHATTTHHSQPSHWWTFVCGRWWHQCCFTSARCWLSRVAGEHCGQQCVWLSVWSRRGQNWKILRRWKRGRLSGDNTFPPVIDTSNILIVGRLWWTSDVFTQEQVHHCWYHQQW